MRAFCHRAVSRTLAHLLFPQRRRGSLYLSSADWMGRNFSGASSVLPRPRPQGQGARHPRRASSRISPTTARPGRWIRTATTREGIPRSHTALGAGAAAGTPCRRQVSCLGRHSHAGRSFQGQDRVERLWNALGYSLQAWPPRFARGRVPPECLLAVVLIPAAFFIPVGATERALMVASVLLVLIVELLNSAVEAASTGSRWKITPRKAGEGHRQRRGIPEPDQCRLVGRR